MPGATSTFSSLLCFVLLALEPASVVQLTFQVAPPRRAAASSNPNDNLINTANLRYSTNISIAGNVVNVLIDTGSTDLWVMPPQGLTNFNDTGLSMTLHYYTSANFVTGDIGVGAFQLNGGEFAVPQQAYLQGTSEAGEAADFVQGHFGILGLGFDTPGASFINAAVQTAFGTTSTVEACVGYDVAEEVILRVLSVILGFGFRWSSACTRYDFSEERCPKDMRHALFRYVPLGVPPGFGGDMYLAK
ncbi:hypothetical protein K438DRAFT_1988296 [Mycena galopus ATCC 62051]|nr:hypothetical protein K438DRAFT_1988296 [Mycena galopus ATCC 62051]